MWYVHSRSWTLYSAANFESSAECMVYYICTTPTACEDGAIRIPLLRVREQPRPASSPTVNDVMTWPALESVQHLRSLGMPEDIFYRPEDHGQPLWG